MAERKKRIGRPTKPGTAGQRNSLGLRVTADTKRNLEAAALQFGRSQSQEAELRIEQSFLKEEVYGGKELNGLLMLMVGAAKIIQARTGKSWSSDWETSVAVRAAWTKLGAAAAPRPPAEFIQHYERGYETVQPPELPTSPSPPRGISIVQLYGDPNRATDAKTFAAEMAVFQKAYKKYDRLRAEYERKVEAFRQDTQAWLDTITRNENLGKDVAADLFPRREAVLQTAIPTQRVDKSKEN